MLVDPRPLSMRYRLGAHRWSGVGPESSKHCWGQRRPHRRVDQNSWVTERGGGEVVVKPNTAGGSVGRARWRHRKVVQNLYTTTWQSNIFDPFTPPPPKETRNRADEGGGPSQGFLYVFTKVQAGLKQEITGSAAQQGWCPRSAACNSWCILHPAVCA